MKPAAPRFGPWWLVGFLSAAAALNYADRAAFSAVLAPLQSELGLSNLRVGLAASLFLWSYAFASPFAGSLADRASRSRMVVISLLWWSVFMAFTGAANGLIVLCLLRIGLGLGESLFHPASFALIADHHGPTTRARAMSYVSAAAQFGIVAGGATAGFIAQYFGWRAGFWILGAGGVGLAAVARWFIADAPKPASVAPSAGSGWQALAYFARVPSFYFLMAKSILTGMPAWMMFTWLPLYLLETFHLKLGMAGFTGSFMLQALLVVGLTLGGWLSDAVGGTHGERRLMLLGFFYLLATPFPLIFLGQPTFAAIALAMSVCALFRGLGEANQQPVICDIVPPAFRSTAFGIHNTLATAAGGVGAFFAGMLKSHVGLPAVFAAVAALYLINGLALLIAGRYFVPRDIARASQFGHDLG